MPTLARRIKPSLLVSGLLAFVAGAALLGLEFGTSVFANESGELGRGWLKLALFGALLVVSGAALCWQGVRVMGCSACGVELVEGARRVDARAWETLRRLVVAGSQGQPEAMLQVAQAPAPSLSGAQGEHYAVFSVTCCPRCRQLAVATARLDREGQYGAEPQQSAPVVIVRGPLAARLAELAPAP